MELTPIQQQVIASLAAGASISAAPKSAGIHRSTIYNWLNEPNPPSTGRNTPCPCGSGRKYKRCRGVGAPPILNAA